ncbi:MAG: hypothetical protein EAZ89_03335 [Bacteroidetes bacterium]|nr:MAG: hypothetical protein EAZ89_03335 [Bacteroidota bacterium]
MLPALKQFLHEKSYIASEGSGLGKDGDLKKGHINREQYEDIVRNHLYHSRITCLGTVPGGKFVF